METYKRGVQDEGQIIDHIKFIAKDLFKESSPERNNNFTFKGKQKKSRSKEFIRTPHRKASEREKGEKYPATAHSSNGLVSTLPNKSRSKKKRIFESFDEFWEKCHHSPERKTSTPLIDRINKSIYNQFRVDTKNANEMTDRVIDGENCEASWVDFLRRDEEWKKERQAHRMEREMKEISSQSPEIRSRVKTTSNVNVNYRDIHGDMEMTQVQKSLKMLRLQTQKLRRKVLNISDSQKRPLSKTYKDK